MSVSTVTPHTREDATRRFDRWWTLAMGVRRAQRLHPRDGRYPYLAGWLSVMTVRLFAGCLVMCWA